MSFRRYQFSKEDWEVVCARFDNRCASCKEVKALTVDHIFPRAAGGTDAISNIQPLCSRCNARKNSRHIDFSKPGAIIPSPLKMPRERRITGLMRLNLKLLPEQHKKLKSIASMRGLSMKDLVLHWIDTAPETGIAPAAVAEPKAEYTTDPTDKG